VRGEEEGYGQAGDIRTGERGGGRRAKREGLENATHFGPERLGTGLKEGGRDGGGKKLKGEVLSVAQW